MEKDNNISTVCAMFEELKQQLVGLEDKMNNTTKSDKLNEEIFEGLYAIAESLCKVIINTRQIAETIDEIKQESCRPTTTHKRHHFLVEFKSGKTIGIIALLLLMLVFSLVENYNQSIKNKELISTDWKYRYIKMSNGVSAQDLSLLEDIFTNPDKEKIVKELQKEVRNYEQWLENEIKKQMLLRKKEQEAKQIDREIEDIKKNK